MDRTTSLRILGLTDAASDDEVRAAWWALRAHVEARRSRAGTPEQRAARERDLSELEAMSSLFGLQAVASARERWLVGWGAVASLLAAGLAVALLWPDSGPRALVGGSGSGEPGADGLALETGGEAGRGSAGGETTTLGERARVVANAHIEGALLEIEAEGGGVVVGGPADDTDYWVAPGRYAVRVRYGDCDPWEQQVVADAGSEHLLAPEICGDTSWLVVQANVEGARVEVDGNELGATGPSRYTVAPGEREVRVVKPGYAPWEGIVALDPGREVTLKPRLAPSTPSKPKPEAKPEPEPTSPAPVVAPAAAPVGAAVGAGSVDGIEAPHDPEQVDGWHRQTRQWLLARYDTDRSGGIDSQSELDAISCELWLGIEGSYDDGRLGLSMTRFFGFDGDGWKPDSLGIDSKVRDLTFRRMRDCGLRK